MDGRIISDRNKSWLATYVWLLAVFWTAVICASVTWNLLKQNQSMQEIVLSEARAYFNKVPTSFKLSDEQVDRLIAVGRQLLREHPDFQRLLADLNTP